MTNLTAPRNIPFRAGDAVAYLPTSGTQIFTGALVELIVATGYIQPWQNGSTNAFAGVALEGNMTPLAELSQGGIATTGYMNPNTRGISVGRSGRLYRFPYSAAAITNVGQPVYATDDHTVTLVAQTQRIGTVVDFESGFLWIDFSGFIVPPTAPSSYPVDLSAATGTGTALAETIGTVGSPIAISTVNQSGVKEYYTTANATGTTYGHYTLLTSTGGAAGEAIAGRNRVYLSTAATANAHGSHATLELDATAGNVTGLGTGLRGNVVVGDRAVAAGTYYGVFAEIYASGNTAALPAGSNAALGINVQPGTAMDLVGNLIAFAGTDGSTKPIYTHAAGNTSSGSIRILVNGAKKFMRFYDAE
jgi:hypothetical protein